jgi:hypothetical protein
MKMKECQTFLIQQCKKKTVAKGNNDSFVLPRIQARENVNIYEILYIVK